MSAMTYKGYAARVEYAPDDELFVGRLAGINDIITFHADTVDGLKAAFHEAVDDYLGSCEKVGRTPEKPYSGRVMFRIAPEVHAAAADAAERAGQSLNEWAGEALRAAATAGRTFEGARRYSPRHRFGQIIDEASPKRAAALNDEKSVTEAPKSIFPEAAAKTASSRGIFGALAERAVSKPKPKPKSVTTTRAK